MINEYKNKWFRREVPYNEYDACRFAPDKVAFAKDWIKRQRNGENLLEADNVVGLICREKVNLITAPYSELEPKMKWSDKVGVYDLLHEKGFDTIQVPYVFKGYCKQIDMSIFDYMTEEGATYIIKTNHGSGWNIRYTVGKGNKENIIKNVNAWLNQNYAYISGCEYQYKWIKPGIVIQKLLTDVPLDWSFWCIDGEIEGIGLTKKFGKNYEEYVAFSDKDGNMPKWFIGAEPEMMFLNKKQKEIIEKMKPYVYEIAKGFKFVRVDMYYANGQIYFGEATFTPCSGILDVSFT